LLRIVGGRCHVVSYVVLFNGGGRFVILTQVGLRDGVDVQVSAPLDHALEDAHETLETADAHTLLLVGGGAQFQGLPTLGDFRQVVDQPLKNIGGGQITVVVYVNVHYTLGISTNSRQCLKSLE
jgi:N-acyl-D-aspartate/D-glutamate deacylase